MNADGLRQGLRSDTSLYRRLRFPRGALWARLRIWVGSPGFFVLAVQRLDRRLLLLKAERGLTVKTAVMHLLVALGRALAVLRAKADFLASTEIDPGVYLSDRGHLILGARRIGAGTLIHDRVTIGMGLMDQGKPAIGENVWIGSDCVIYGNIEIGRGATVLPGTVLSKSIPGGCVVAGNPARVVHRNFDNTTLRSSLSTAPELPKAAAP